MTKTAEQIQELLSESGADVKDKIELLRLKLESERLNTESKRFNREHTFLSRNFVAVLTATVSFAAVVASFSQVWVAKIQNEQQLLVTESLKDRELRTAQSQKEKETILMAEQQNRAWKLDMARFIAEHRNELFGKDAIQKALMRNVVLTSFPADISADFFAKLEVLSTSSRETRELQAIRKELIPKIEQAPSSVAVTWEYSGDNTHPSPDEYKLRTIFDNVAKNIK